MTGTAAHGPVAVLGAGSWGTALAIHLARRGREVLLWGHRPDFVEELARERRNPRYLPDIPFPQELHPLPSLEEVLQRSGDLLLAVPVRGLRGLLDRIAAQPPPGLSLAWSCKGLEAGTRKLVHQVVEEVLGPVQGAVVSGPTFAAEVARGLPSALTVASREPHTAQHWAEHLHGDGMRAYTTDDLVGVELGGAVKNVMAIAAGISDGLGFGANARAALITRALAEMMRLGVAMGGRRETFMGLAGLGDLVLTCTDDQSRNRRFGLALARGCTPDQARESIGQAVEGEKTTFEVAALARELEIEMPITDQVAAVLRGRTTPAGAVESLLSRERKPEIPG